MRLLRLSEYRTEPAVRLSPEERDALRRVAGVTVEPTPGTSDHYDVTPASRIGALSVGSLGVEIRPKVPIDRVLFLLSYAIDPASWQATGFDFEQDESLLEAIIPGFIRQVGIAIRPGLLQGYRTEEDALTTVRGRIRFDDQVRKRYGIAPPVEVRFDEFTEDVDVNRLIKAALTRLHALRIRSRDVKQALRGLDVAFAPVSMVRFDAKALPVITWNRLNQRYRAAVELARLILRATSYELHHGGVRSSGFLIDMNRVFEDFAVVALREALGVDARAFPQGDGQLRLDAARNVTLRPDISWWEEGRCVFVGDLKYKRVGQSGTEHPDLYQLLSYLVAADLPVGLLIYAAGEADEAVHEVVNIGRRLTVTAVDLSGSPAKILAEIRTVAGQISSMRAGYDSRSY
jgi:5-methylcytosine-specific restriction enzyme subunit McrC